MPPVITLSTSAPADDTPRGTGIDGAWLLPLRLIDTEGGTAHMDVRRIDRPQSWEELLSIISEVAADPNVCKTLVLDTADWAEALCVAYVCQKYKQNSIESFGYGKGYTILGEEFGRLFAALDAVIASGKNVVITAHAKMRKFEQPDEQGAYDRWEMKLSKQVAPLLKEWCDMLLFLNYKTYVVTTETNAKKAQGGKRVIYTSHHPCWDAKNRREQAYVAEFITRCLSDHGYAPEADGPRPMRAGNVVHLCTDFAFPLRHTHRLGTLLAYLHPTPAVCGYPKEEAYRFIAGHEGLDRRYYAGFLGWLDPAGRTDLYVNLRCMEWGAGAVHFYAGGGIMPESEWRSEWNETALKMRPLTNYFQ